jgi:hypothetical protein
MAGGGFRASAPPVDEVQQQTGKPIWVVARNSVMGLKQWNRDRDYPEGFDLHQIISDGFSLLSSVPPPHPNWKRAVVQESEIKNIPPDML